MTEKSLHMKVSDQLTNKSTAETTKPKEKETVNSNWSAANDAPSSVGSTE